MNWKVILVGSLFLLPQLFPYMLGRPFSPLNLEEKIQRMGDEAEEIAPTGRAVEVVKKAESTSLNIISVLKKTSLAVGSILVLIGIFI